MRFSSILSWECFLHCFIFNSNITVSTMSVLCLSLALVRLIPNIWVARAAKMITDDCVLVSSTAGSTLTLVTSVSHGSHLYKCAYRTFIVRVRGCPKWSKGGGLPQLHCSSLVPILIMDWFKDFTLFIYSIYFIYSSLCSCCTIYFGSVAGFAFYLLCHFDFYLLDIRTTTCEWFGLVSAANTYTYNAEVHTFFTDSGSI